MAHRAFTDNFHCSLSAPIIFVSSHDLHPACNVIFQGVFRGASIESPYKERSQCLLATLNSLCFFSFFFCKNWFFTRKSYQPSAQFPTWRTKGSLFVWFLWTVWHVWPYQELKMTSANITLEVTGTRKPPTTNKVVMLVSKLHSRTCGTCKTMHMFLFWKSHCATCSPACVILYHVTGSCKGPIVWNNTQNTFPWELEEINFKFQKNSQVNRR